MFSLHAVCTPGECSVHAWRMHVSRELFSLGSYDDKVDLICCSIRAGPQNSLQQQPIRADKQ